MLQDTFLSDLCPLWLCSTGKWFLYLKKMSWAWSNWFNRRLNFIASGHERSWGVPMIRLLHFSNLSKKSNLDYSRVNPFTHCSKSTFLVQKINFILGWVLFSKKVLKALIKSLRFDSQEGKYVVFIWIIDLYMLGPP